MFMCDIYVVIFTFIYIYFVYSIIYFFFFFFFILFIHIYCFFIYLFVIFFFFLQVIEIDPNHKGRIRVVMTVSNEPNFEVVKRKQDELSTKYLSGEICCCFNSLKGDSPWALYGQPLGLATVTVGLRPPAN